MQLTIMFQLETDDHTKINKTFTDTCINNPINEAQKLLDELKKQGAKAMIPALPT